MSAMCATGAYPSVINKDHETENGDIVTNNTFADHRVDRAQERHLELVKENTHHSSTCTCGLCQPYSGIALNAAPPISNRLLGPGKALILVDHENLCGGPNAPEVVVSTVWKALKDFLQISEYDDTIIGLSKFSGARFMTSLPLNQVSLRIGKGPDGADHALLDAVDVEHDSTRYSSVVIASGDHIFIDLANQFRSRGLLVVNATTSCSSSSRWLALACTIQARLKLGVAVSHRSWAKAA